MNVLRRIAQHKMFVPLALRQNPSLTLRTSFMLGMLGVIGGNRLKNIERQNKLWW